MNVYDYIEAGFKIFGLHGADQCGLCGCGDPGCKAQYKHPIIQNWQRVPHWSDEQIQTMEEMGHFKTGFGVLCDGFIIVDVDPRNGGDVTKLPIDIEKTFTVETGGGGLHVYYRAPEGVALVSHHPDHPGVDFKSTGFVVGAGSLHKTGGIYEKLHGHPSAIADAPESLLELLRRPDRFRVGGLDRGAIDIGTEDILSMLNHIDPDSPYDEWVRVGMAIHHATQGSGFELWDTWSRAGKKYTGMHGLERHWHSFGKTANPAGIGTLIFYAERGGYSQSVEFTTDQFFNETTNEITQLDEIDLNAPPGFVGDLVRWINDQCRYPAEQLATSAALVALSAVTRGAYIDERDGIHSNLMTFNVAGSGTGKEAVQEAITEILRATGQEASAYGGLKSEQELVRNLIRDRCSMYAIDEFGIFLGKLANAKKSGAHYLEGVIGAIMSIYSKAGGFFLPTGDVKEEIEKTIRDQLASANKQLEKTGDQKYRDKIEILEKKLLSAPNGIEKPYLCVAGFTTPVTFDGLMTQEMASNGFMARAILFQNLETNPRMKPGFKKSPMPMGMALALAAISNASDCARIPTDDDGSKALDDVYEYFYEMGENEKARSGLEAICRRGYEIAAKVSFLLAIPGGLRTAQHVRWAFALAKRDIETKIRLAYANMKEQTSPADALAVRVTKLVSDTHGETRAVLANRCSTHTKTAVFNAIDRLLEAGILEERPDAESQRKTVKIFAVNSR